MNWLDSVAETSGHPTGNPEILSLEAICAMGEAITKAMPIYTKGLRLVSRKQRIGYWIGVGAIQRRIGPAALAEFRRISAMYDTTGFDVGISIHAGQVISTPPENLTDHSALVGFYLAHGLIGNPSYLELLKLVVREPEYRIGVAVAVRSINDERKGPIQKMIESVLGV